MNSETIRQTPETPCPIKMSLPTESLAAAEKKVRSTYAALCSKTGEFPRAKQVLDQLGQYVSNLVEDAKENEVSGDRVNPHQFTDKIEAALSMDVEDLLDALNKHRIAQKEYFCLKEAAKIASSGSKKDTQESAKKRARKDSD